MAILCSRKNLVEKVESQTKWLIAQPKKSQNDVYKTLLTSLFHHLFVEFIVLIINLKKGTVKRWDKY